MSDHPTRGRRQAVALAYHDANDAPRVVAQGYGELAERIIAEAHRQGIHVHDAPELVGLLMQLDLDEAIPRDSTRSSRSCWSGYMNKRPRQRRRQSASAIGNRYGFHRGNLCKLL